MKTQPGSHTYVYRKCPGERVWTVGFYDPTGQWYAESDHVTSGEAAARVHYLHGGTQNPPIRTRKEGGANE